MASLMDGWRERRLVGRKAGKKDKEGRNGEIINNKKKIKGREEERE